MKLRKYLEEEYIATEKIGNHTFEIFKNPSKKELSELRETENDWGFRCIADMKGKNLYIASADILHYQMMGIPEIKYKTGIDWVGYFEKLVGIDQYILFDCNVDMKRLNSDSYNNFDRKSGDQRQKIVSDLYKLLELDYNWVRKYKISPVEMKTLVKNAITIAG